MNCKCGELKSWLKKEINHLEELKEVMTPGSKLYHIVDAKISSYLIVLEGLD